MFSISDLSLSIHLVLSFFGTNFDKYLKFEMDYIIPFPNMRIYLNDMNEGIQESC